MHLPRAQDKKIPIVFRSFITTNLYSMPSVNCPIHLISPDIWIVTRAASYHLPVWCWRSIFFTETGRFYISLVIDRWENDPVEKEWNSICPFVFFSTADNLPCDPWCIRPLYPLMATWQFSNRFLRGEKYLPNVRRWSNVVLMLGQRRRQ